MSLHGGWEALGTLFISRSAGRRPRDETDGKTGGLSRRGVLHCWHVCHLSTIAGHHGPVRQQRPRTRRAAPGAARPRLHRLVGPHPTLWDRPCAPGLRSPGTRPAAAGSAVSAWRGARGQGHLRAAVLRGLHAVPPDRRGPVRHRSGRARGDARRARRGGAHGAGATPRGAAHPDRPAARPRRPRDGAQLRCDEPGAGASSARRPRRHQRPLGSTPRTHHRPAHRETRRS